MAATKINLTKTHAHYIVYSTINVVQGLSYKNFSTQKFVIRKFHYTKISRSTILYVHVCRSSLTCGILSQSGM